MAVRKNALGKKKTTKMVALKICWGREKGNST